MTFLDACAEACQRHGISLTDDEELQLAEMQCEGLATSQAPQFIASIRRRTEQRNGQA